MMQKSDTILVTGATGLVGKNLVNHLKAKGFANVIGFSSRYYDLTDADFTQDLFREYRPRFVFHMAGYVRGIMGNMKAHGESYRQNTLMAVNVIHACHKFGVDKIVAMGTVAMYPVTDTVLSEDMVLSGEPHPSERGYAYAKRGMLVQLQAYHEQYGLKYAFPISTNLYGPHDRFDAENGHCIPSLIRKFYDAEKSGGDVEVWGDGSAKRDFLYVKDAVEQLSFIMDEIEGPVNLTTGASHSILDVVDILAGHTGMNSRIKWNSSKPIGQSSRYYRSTFVPHFTLHDGLTETYDWYAANQAHARK